MKATKPRNGKFRGAAIVARAAIFLLFAPQANAFFHNSPDLEQGRAIYEAECASCHGANSRDQAGNNSPTNKPEALREVLRAWKLLP